MVKNNLYLACDLKYFFTSTILSPVFRVPFCPAGLSSRMCLIKMPLITSPLFSRLPIPRPPTILIPRDLPGARKSSTLMKVRMLDFNIYPFKAVTVLLIWYSNLNCMLDRKKDFYLRNLLFPKCVFVCQCFKLVPSFCCISYPNHICHGHVHKIRLDAYIQCVLTF